MKFKREVSRTSHLEDRFVNNFYKQGFINEDVFDRDSRDIWKAFIKLLSNSNTSAIFTSLLIAYKEVPYSAELLQESMVNSQKKLITDGYDNKASEIFVDVKMDYYKFYECIFIKSPYMYNINTRSKECIYNTMKIMNDQFSEAQGYTIVPSSWYALNDAGNTAIDGDIDYIDMNEDLFIREAGKNKEIKKVIMLVPMLIDDSYYMIDGIKTYPIITEAYHYSTSRFGQKEFICKNNSGKKFASKYNIILGYFDSAFLDMGNGPEIFYIKTSKRLFYNPLMFINKFEAKQLVNEIMSDRSVKPHIKKILQNTYEHYLSQVDELRADNQNLIPNVKVWRHNDSFFDEELEKSFSDENFVVKKFNRRMIPVNMIKSLIMGFNNVRYYTFYGHMNDIYMMSTNKISNKKKTETRDIPSNELPKDKLIYATIRSNKDLCANYDNTNPYDVWARVSYKKYANPSTSDIKNANGGDVTKSPPKDFMRYLTEEEYTIIDPTTVKSETTAGLVSSFTLFNHRKGVFKKADEI